MEARVRGPVWRLVWGLVSNLRPHIIRGVRNVGDDAVEHLRVGVWGLVWGPVWRLVCGGRYVG